MDAFTRAIKAKEVLLREAGGSERRGPRLAICDVRFDSRRESGCHDCLWFVCMLAAIRDASVLSICDLTADHPPLRAFTFYVD